MDRNAADDHPVGAWQLIVEDFHVHRNNPLSAGFHALLVHRLGCSIDRSRSRRGRGLWMAYRIAHAVITAAYGIELPASARIGRRLSLPHPQGVVLIGGSTVGDDCMLRHNVTLGVGSAERGDVPTLGDRVEIGPGAIVMGGVTIGDDVRIGPSAVVITDVPAGWRALAPAALVRPSSRARCPERP